MAAEKFSPPPIASRSCKQQIQVTNTCEQKWCDRTKNNNPQSNALGAASLIFTSGGMNIAWSTTTQTIHSTELLTHLRICWFVSAIGGAAIGATLASRVLKKPIFMLASILVLIGGILFVSLPDTLCALIVARYLDGFANGLIFAPALCLAGEVSISCMRGLVTAIIEHMSFNAGIFLEFIFTASCRSDSEQSFVIERVHGILSIGLSVAAIAMTLLFTVESPVYYLLRNREQEAVEALRRLQRPYMVTSETFVQLNEHKGYIAANKSLTLCQAAVQGLPALVKLCALRLLNGMSISLVAVTALYMTTHSLSKHIDTWPIAVFGGMRWLGSLLAVFMLDCTGRKMPTLFSFFISGALAIAFAAFLNTENYKLSHMMLALALFYQFFASLANASSSVYLSEAFPLTIKPYYIAVAYVVELIFSLVFCRQQQALIDAITYFYILGSLAILFFVLGIFCLPETKSTTLTEAQEKFRKMFNNDF